jgi:1,6-anhydro-N-acetylmuramate kinase
MGFYLGLMSGTSMDAIDAALVDFDVSPLRIIAASATAFAPELKRRIAKILDSSDNAALDELGQIDVELAKGFAKAALALLRDAALGAGRVTAIGSHGQTLRHRPDLPTPFTWQIGDPNTLTEMTGITVVADFRRRDVAAGGAWAGTGQCDDTLLQQLLDEPYLRLPPPKSTGRELFNMPWLKKNWGRSHGGHKTYRPHCSNSRLLRSQQRSAGTPPAPRCTYAAAARTMPHSSNHWRNWWRRTTSRPPRRSVWIRITSRQSPSHGLRGAHSAA